MRQFYAWSFRLMMIIIVANFLPLTLFAQPVLSFRSVVSSGLTSPVEIANARDGSNRIFIVQQNGQIRIYDGSALVSAPFLNISARLGTGGERGLLSLAFHPAYATNGKFFVYYTRTDGDITVEQFTVSADPNVADINSGKVLMTIEHSSADNHNGGHLQFGPDGNLYFATGDGGGSGDPDDNGQNIASQLGKMIRINVDNFDTPPYYTVPAGNPFIGGVAVDDIIWATGLRNPYRWSFDRLNGNMWIADVGQGAWEEVNVRTPANSAGVNYGWNCMEGTHVYGPGGCPVPANYAGPILDYPHNTAQGGSSITGGYVYRGTTYPAMYGAYIFADYVSGNVWALPENGEAGDTIMYKLLRANITSFGESEQGELYATTIGGGFFEVMATGTAVVPVDLTSIKATTRNGINDISWTTQNEVGVSQYEIEYSYNGADFQQAGVISATNAGSYRFAHMIVPRQQIFYRVKVIDIDGRFEYSRTVALHHAGENEIKFVMPSVISNNQLNVLLTDEYTNIQVVSLEGRQVWRQNITGRSGRIEFTLPALNPGHYVVMMDNGDKSISQRILIK